MDLLSESTKAGYEGRPSLSNMNDSGTHDELNDVIISAPRRVKGTLPRLSDGDIARFHSKVGRLDDEDKCWEWKAGRFPEGYGEFWVGSKASGGRMYSANRIAYLIHNGPFAPEMLVCHSCDNPPCCNPRHLWLGSDADNIRDKVEKGRDNNYTGDDHWTRKKPHLLARGPRDGSYMRGENHYKAKLNENNVRDARARFGSGLASVKQLAIELGVSESNMQKVVNRETWKRVI